MVWVSMPGETWVGSGVRFVAMWLVMMVAMMLPPLLPMLTRLRGDQLPALAGAGYFSVWAVFGAVVYVGGSAIARAELAWPAVARVAPQATGAALLLAGAVQLTPWKARQLAVCRSCGAPASPGALATLAHGVRFGVSCSLCCLGLMAVLVVGGMMNVAVVAGVGLAVALERLGPRPVLVARAIGTVVMILGVAMLARTTTPLLVLGATLVAALGGCKTHTRERAGHFEIRSVREEFAGHAHTTMSLAYHRRKVADGLTDWTIDPRRPDRIVYASTTPCGTFFLDATTQRSLVLAPVPMIVHAAEDDSPEFAGSNPWSPDGRHVWLGNDIANPIVVDLDGGEGIDLTDALSAGGQRRPMTALMWSPDGDQVAVIVQPGGYNDPDRDLVAITLSPLRAGYVATLTESAGRGLVLWTTADVAWHDGHLVVASRDRRASIIMKSPGQLGWTPTRPGAPPVALEGAACP